MKYRILFTLLIFSALGASAQWTSKTIPDSLLSDANAVIRRYATVIELPNAETMIVKVNKVVTVLNEKGEDFGNFDQNYNSDSKVSFIKGIVYDDSGNKIKKIKKEDIKDYSLVSDFSVYEDNRVLFMSVISNKYPYTVEYEYKIVYNNIISLPIWYPNIGYYVSLESASLKLLYADELQIRHKSFNISDPQSLQDENDYVALYWELAGSKAQIKEQLSPYPFEYFPAVVLGPTDFIYHNYSGKLDSWTNYANWVQNLLVNRNDLSAKLKEQMRMLTADATNQKERIRRVYKYMQSHTRYVSIQEGIGGFQPFPPSLVENFGYGDCKALTFFTKSLLESVGVKSYYCEIGINGRGINFIDFPSFNQTNHVVLCVPVETDTLWLECTNQYIPFSFLSYDMLNQKALIVKEKDGGIVFTPKASVNKNIQNRKISIVLDNEGNGICDLRVSVYGAEMENLFPEIWSSKAEQKEIIQKKYNKPGVLINSFNYKVIEEPTLSAQENVNIQITRLASSTGNRLFIPLNPLSNRTNVPSKDKKRRNKVVVNQCYTNTDSLSYLIPDGYKIEYLPESKRIESKFGFIEVKTSASGNKIEVVKRLVINRNSYPAEDFISLVDFLQENRKVDQQSITLVKV